MSMVDSEQQTFSLEELFKNKNIIKTFLSCSRMNPGRLKNSLSFNDLRVPQVTMSQIKSESRVPVVCGSFCLPYLGLKVNES